MFWLKQNTIFVLYLTNTKINAYFSFYRKEMKERRALKERRITLLKLFHEHVK